MPEMPEMPFTCPACVTWSCDICGHCAYYQNPDFTGTRRCNVCGSSIGTIREVRHTSLSIAEDHWEQSQFEKMAQHDRIQHRKRHGDDSLNTPKEYDMPESPAREHTAQDFEKAEWAKHPTGLFAHRGGPHVGGAAWAVASPISDDVTYYTDVELADRGDFEIVETSTVITRRRLNQIIDEHGGDLNANIEEVITEAGVKIAEDKPLPIPQDFGVRFIAKSEAGLVEWEFVTVRVPTEDGEGIGLLCTDIRDWNGMCLPPAEFTERGFRVVELL